MSYVSREEWGAKPPVDWDGTLPREVERVVYTCNIDVDLCFTKEDCIQRMKELQNHDIQRGLNDIFFNFLVGGDGAVYEGRGWIKSTSKKSIWEQIQGERLDIAFIGRYGQFNKVPEELIINASSFLHDFIEKKFIKEKPRVEVNVFR